jgi:hypothetical protein
VPVNSELEGVPHSHAPDLDKFHFEELTVYRKSLDYVDFVYRTTKDFPRSEVFSLTDQMLRASVSISLNIAEGSGGSKSEFSNTERVLVGLDLKLRV